MILPFDDARRARTSRRRVPERESGRPSCLALPGYARGAQAPPDRGRGRFGRRGREEGRWVSGVVTGMLRFNEKLKTTALG